MLHTSLPSVGRALRASAPALQLCSMARPAAAAPRCVQTVSLLDFHPPGPASPSKLENRCRGKPAAACTSVAARWGSTAAPSRSPFSTAPFSAIDSSAISSETTTYLRNPHNGAEIYVVGTAHISRDSADEVRRLIRLVKPDAVMIELDAGRAARLRSGRSASFIEFLTHNLLGIFIPGPQWGASVVRFGIGSMYQIMRLVGLEPGGEFKAAMQEAEAVGARVVYGDQPVELTGQRIAADVGVKDLARLLFGRSTQPDDSQQQEQEQHKQQRQKQKQQQQKLSGVEGRVEAMKTRKAASQMREQLRQSSPQLAAVLLDERDQYMVNQLRQLSGKVVAVVGLAHLDGIEAKWKEGNGA